VDTDRIKLIRLILKATAKYAKYQRCGQHGSGASGRGVDRGDLWTEVLRMGKRRRFGDLVRESGRPEVATLWTEPKNDRAFSKAIRENRVLTVESDPASKRKDFGRIGFHQVRGGIYLVFPKALPNETDSRIVGINYQLAEERSTRDPVTTEFEEELIRKAKARKEKAAGKGGRRELGIAEKAAAPPKPVLKTFEVTVRRIVTRGKTAGQGRDGGCGESGRIGSR
jgi:hypothetical protein